MAADKDLVITEGASKNKKLIIAGAVVLILLLAGGAYFFLFNGQDKAATDKDGIELASDGSVKALAGSALYVPLPRPFVFNVPGSSRDRMVQIRVQLLLRGKENEILAMRHIPLIEGSLLQTFSSANADDLSAAAGRDALKNKALSDLQQALLEVVGSVVVDEVLFTGFVMQ
ncbi:flagellar basal body-associated protein FliL [Rheinheimera sp. MMS21-TC3]|uniref:flagellar basal body-associated protein FliL n=1 Tax=Rheinheimera sp. MMS21-TC3 TaxID=3072790 RepID=UPI0028C50C6B|nr:flagellar basal body-associated protein FliL [Rheinheimera sp. MMS21-TC3]WNO61791.1 flagellar basal body-associated protein FliL [Rheinheimera sp. MMS21-TC3]